MSYEKPLSYSSMSLYKQCPRRWAWSYIEGNWEATSPAAARGTRIHQAIEDFFNGKTTFPSGVKELAPWQSRLEALVAHSPVAEGEIAVDSSWVVCGYRDERAYVRGKVDLTFAHPETGHHHIIDWKTGKEYPNHVEQGQIYTAMAPDAETSVVQFWYIDQPHIIREWTYSHADQLIFREKWTETVEAVRSATEYPATPSDKCTWCPLSWRKGGECKRAR